MRVTLKPAPQGVGLAVGDVAKSVLRLAGIRDAWAFTQGHTKTTVNYALATFDAVKRTALVKVTEDQTGRLKIHAGAEKVYVRGAAPAGAPPEEGATPPPPPDEAPQPPKEGAP